MLFYNFINIILYNFQNADISAGISFNTFKNSFYEEINFNSNHLFMVLIQIHINLLYSKFNDNYSFLVFFYVILFEYSPTFNMKIYISFK